MKFAVNKERARFVKELLYNGREQDEIAKMAGIDQSTISRIKAGKLHGDVQWPNGEVGPIPIEADRRARNDEHLKWSTEVEAFNSMPAQLQDRIFQVVNDNRAAQGVDPIPEAAPEYSDYLTSPAEAEDAIDLIRARDAEDMRIRELMREWRELLEAERASQRSDELLHILDATPPSQVEEPSNDWTEVTPMASSLSYDKLDWDEVESRAYSLDIVQEAVESESTSLREACCIVFYAIKNRSLEHWKEPHIEREIRKLAQQLAERDFG